MNMSFFVWKLVRAIWGPVLPQFLANLVPNWFSGAPDIPNQLDMNLTEFVPNWVGLSDALPYIFDTSFQISFQIGSSMPQMAWNILLWIYQFSFQLGSRYLRSPWFRGSHIARSNLIWIRQSSFQIGLGFLGPIRTYLVRVCQISFQIGSSRPQMTRTNFCINMSVFVSNWFALSGFLPYFNFS